MQCEDTEAEIIVFKKGEIVDVPCHYEHKVRSQGACSCSWSSAWQARARRGAVFKSPATEPHLLALHSLQRHGKKWHWKPSQKRKTHGDVCECEC